MQYFGYSVNIIFVIVALLLFQRIFLFHVQFVNGMNTSYVQIRNELASEQLIKVQFQVAMSGRYTWYWWMESAYPQGGSPGHCKKCGYWEPGQWPSTYHYGLSYEIISPNQLPGNTKRLVWEEGKVMACFCYCQKGGWRRKVHLGVM